MNYTLKAKKYSPTLFFFLLFAALGFQYHGAFYEGDALNFIVADSKYYFDLAERVDSLADIILFTAVNKNLFGPLFYYDFILQSSRILFFLFSSLVLIHALRSLYKCMKPSRQATLVTIFLLINPVVLFSLSGPNKEITGYVSMLYFMCHLVAPNWRMLFLALIFALFTRFEMIGLIVVSLFLLKLNAKWRLIYILGVLIGLSLLIWVTNYSHIEKLDANTRDGSLGVVRVFALASSEGLYFLVFLPKLLINLYGNLIALNPLQIDGNSINLFVSQVLFFFLSLEAIKRKAYKLRSNFTFVFIIYCLVFCVPAFIQHRYFVPAYPLIVVMALTRDFAWRQRTKNRRNEQADATSSINSKGQ